MTPAPAPWRTPWTARLASILIGLQSAMLGAFGLILLFTSLTGGGVSFGSSPTGDRSPLAGVLLGLAILGLAGAIMAVSIGVERGGLVPSLIAVGLGALFLVGGVVERMSGQPRSIVPQLVLPAVQVALLVSPRNLADLRARRAGRRGSGRRGSESGQPIDTSTGNRPD